MSYNTYRSTPTISTRSFPGHYWQGEWCAPRTLVTDGFTDFWVHGERAGDDLYVFLGGMFVDLDAGVVTHADAVAWAERQFAPTEGRVAA